MIIDFHTHTFPDKSSEKIVNHLAHIGCIPPHTKFHSIFSDSFQSVIAKTEIILYGFFICCFYDIIKLNETFQDYKIYHIKPGT